MSRLSPKPIIAQVHKTWQVSLGMSFSVVEDLERHVWVVQSCPVGTRAWTLEQAALLPRGAKTRRPLREAVALGREIQHRNVTQVHQHDEIVARSRNATPVLSYS